MNKHYQKAIVVEAVNRLRAKGHEVSFEEIWALVKREYASSEAAGDADDNWGNFESDVEFLVELWEEENVEDEAADEAQAAETTIEEAVSKLHVGFNFIPGIGVGYCSNEEDLKAMQDFVRGGMAVTELLGRILGL